MAWTSVTPPTDTWNAVVSITDEYVTDQNGIVMTDQNGNPIKVQGAVSPWSAISAPSDSWSNI